MENEIINLYQKGYKMNEIAKKYNCERHRISRILKKNNINTSRHEKLKGKEFKNKYGDEYIVLEDYVNNGHGECLVEFKKTKYQTIQLSSNVKKGNVKDYYKKTIYGVACRGHIICPKNSFEGICFHRWTAILQRCYQENSVNYNAYGKRGVRMSEEWLNFENFYNDIQKLEGFDKEKFINHEIELDKDTGKNKFSKEYSKENCRFIPIKQNRRYQRKNIKPFKAISPNGDVYIFETQIDCAKKLNMVARTIGKCLNGELKHHHNYTFEYLEPQTTIPHGSSK